MDGFDVEATRAAISRLSPNNNIQVERGRFAASIAHEPSYGFRTLRNEKGISEVSLGTNGE